MAKLTIEEAAEAVGVARQTIWRQTKNGKLSSEVDKNDVRVVDTSELFRIYQPTKTWLARQAGEDSVADGDEAATDATPRNIDRDRLVAELKQWRERFDLAGTLHGKEVSLLQARIEELLRDRDDFRAERDKLLTIVQEQAASVRLLTDQRTPPVATPAPAEQEAVPARRRRFFGFGR